jgi:hypothetical protein
MIVGFGNAGVGKAYFGVSDQFDGFYLPSTMATDNKVWCARAPGTSSRWSMTASTRRAM